MAKINHYFLLVLTVLTGCSENTYETFLYQANHPTRQHVIDHKLLNHKAGTKFQGLYSVIYPTCIAEAHGLIIPRFVRDTAECVGATINFHRLDFFEYVKEVDTNGTPKRVDYAIVSSNNRSSSPELGLAGVHKGKMLLFKGTWVNTAPVINTTEKTIYSPKSTSPNWRQRIGGWFRSSLNMKPKNEFKKVEEIYTFNVARTDSTLIIQKIVVHSDNKYGGPQSMTYDLRAILDNDQGIVLRKSKH